MLTATSTLIQSIHTNPSSAQIGLTRGASNFLWAVFAIMLISDLVFIAWHMRLRRGQRVFHQLPILILTTASIAYFSMASNLGNTPIRTEFDSGHPTRTIWYVRYIDWVSFSPPHFSIIAWNFLVSRVSRLIMSYHQVITTPLLLLELLLGTGLALSDITTVIFMDLAMIITGLVGALVATSYKWGYFTLGSTSRSSLSFIRVNGKRNLLTPLITIMISSVRLVLRLVGAHGPCSCDRWSPGT